MKPRIYLDNAATSWPKPEAVYVAMDEYSRQNGAAAGRGTHKSAIAARRKMEETRREIRSLVNATKDDIVVFCFNGTDAINLCIHGAISEGDHVITTVADHNSVLRPLRQLEETKSILLDVVECDDEGRVSLKQIEHFLSSSTKMVVMTHASNVTGAIQPVAEIGQAVRECGATFLVDAAQTVGAVPVDMQAMHADMLAFSGHKGLLGPLGTGVAVLRAGLDESLRTLRQGGTGTQSENDHQPLRGEDKFESGNPNLPGIYGLSAGIEYVIENADSIRKRKMRQTEMLLKGLMAVPGLKIYGPTTTEDRVGVVSFNLKSMDCHEMAMLLEGQAGIQVRAGLHCAPRIHHMLSTAGRGGTVRVSLGPFNTPAELEKLISTVKSVAAV